MDSVKMAILMDKLVLILQYSKIQKFKNFSIQKFKYSKISVFKNSKISVFKYSIEDVMEALYL